MSLQRVAFVVVLFPTPGKLSRVVHGPFFLGGEVSSPGGKGPFFGEWFRPPFLCSLFVLLPEGESLFCAFFPEDDAL